MKAVATVGMGFALALAPCAASAKLACYPIDSIEQALAAEYGEKRQFAGSETDGIEYRLYVNSETGSWSWIGIPAGTQLGCLIFAGKVKPALPEPSAKPQPPAQF